VRSAVEREAARRGVPLLIKPVGCTGICHRTPLIEIRPPQGEPVTYANLQPAQDAALLDRHLPVNPFTALARRLGRWLGDEVDAELDTRRYRLDDAESAPFTAPQVHIATEGWGEHDPLDLDEYVAQGGFTALRSALRDGSESVITAVTAAGLRGRGGAGFPTGRKWRAARNAPGPAKYVVCNGDEGDPGAFMDRMLLESWPFRVIEGLAIAAIAVGAVDGVLYIRAE
jgi:NADH-quinone oxidoreductase subunit F